MIKFNEFTNNKYPYLRIRKVDIFTSEKRAAIAFYVPEKIYENGFDNALQKDLNKFCQRIAKNFKCEFFFDRMIITEDLCKLNVEEFCLSHYPYISSSISKDCITAEIGDEIKVGLRIEEDVFQVVSKTDFAEKLILYLQETFILPASITFNVVEKGSIEITSTERAQMVKKTVPIMDLTYLCGRQSKNINHPCYIDTIKRASDNASVCGIIDDYVFKELEETEENKKFFKKYMYRMVLNDLTDKITIYFKTNEEDCPLKTYGVGKEVLAKGKIVYSVNLGKFVMYANTIYTCKLDVEKIKEDIKPLPPPDTLKQSAKKYEGTDFLEIQTLEDFDTENNRKEFDCVFLAYNSIAEKKFIPYELTMLKFKKGVCEEVYDTFVKVGNIEGIDPEFKTKVQLARRLSDLVGDILCFTNGLPLICVDPQTVVSEINALGKPQRYVYEPEFFDADKIGMKVSKGEADLRKNLKNNGIVVKGERSYDLAIAMAKLYIKTKK